MILSAGLAATPGQEESRQYSQSPCPEIWTPLESTAVEHHGESPSIDVHLSKILLLKIKGKTQLPQFPLVVFCVEAEGLVVEVEPSEHAADSSPSEAKVNLLETP